MIKHAQTIRWQQPTNCLSVFDHFMRLALKRLTLQNNCLRKLKTSSYCKTDKSFPRSVLLAVQ